MNKFSIKKINPVKQKNLFFILIKSLFKLIIAGVFIGLLHERELVIAFFLFTYLLIVLIRKSKDASEDKTVFFAGVFVTGILGVVCETWGIYNNYWEYHGLDGNREFPYWLPFAWSLAFTFIYKIEKDIIVNQKIKNLSSKILLALLVSIVFPTLGEIITINLGVWTYYWPFKFFGVPLLAIFLLMVFHTAVNLLMTAICVKYKIKNPVFRPTY